jgi:hypothetical protein
MVGQSSPFICNFTVHIRSRQARTDRSCVHGRVVHQASFPHELAESNDGKAQQKADVDRHICDVLTLLVPYVTMSNARK